MFMLASMPWGWHFPSLHVIRDLNSLINWSLFLFVKGLDVQKIALGYSKDSQWIGLVRLRVWCAVTTWDWYYICGKTLIYDENIFIYCLWSSDQAILPFRNSVDLLSSLKKRFFSIDIRLPLSPPGLKQDGLDLSDTRSAGECSIGQSARKA